MLLGYGSKHLVTKHLSTEPCSSCASAFFISKSPCHAFLYPQHCFHFCCLQCLANPSFFSALLLLFSGPLFFSHTLFHSKYLCIIKTSLRFSLFREKTIQPTSPAQCSCRVLKLLMPLLTFLYSSHAWKLLLHKGKKTQTFIFREINKGRPNFAFGITSVGSLPHLGCPARYTRPSPCSFYATAGPFNERASIRSVRFTSVHRSAQLH